MRLHRKTICWLQIYSNTNSTNEQFYRQFGIEMDCTPNTSLNNIRGGASKSFGIIRIPHKICMCVSASVSVGINIITLHYYYSMCIRNQNLW